MMPSTRANPNSVQAVNGRMVDRARLNAPHQQTPTSTSGTPGQEAVAVDGKCTTHGVGRLEGGFRMVYATSRTGRELILMLDVRNDVFAPRLEDAKRSGACLEIIYEEMRSMILNGRILTIS